MELKSIAPVFGMNRLLWAQLVESGLMSKANYNGFVPIIPVAEEPQFISQMDAQPGVMSFPYIVYRTYTNTIDANSWYKQTENVTYTVNAIDQKALRQITLMIVDLFKRYDDSAAVLNGYIAQAYPVPTTTDANGVTTKVTDGPGVDGYEYRCYHYNYTYVVSSLTTPGTTENDPTKVVITVRVNYTDTRNDQPLTIPAIPS